MQPLTSETVTNLFMDCLFNEEQLKNLADGQLPIGTIVVEGIIYKVGFDPAKIAKNKEAISALLNELPIGFKQGSGGGSSFLDACVDKDGKRWGEHKEMDELFMLGMATELVKPCAPRALWPALPGGMPYYVVLETPEKPSEIDSDNDLRVAYNEGV